MVAKKHFDVVCGVMTNELDQVLVSLRSSEQDQGGLWEFPGGKVEIGEPLDEALFRELYEELEIEVLQAEPWMQIHHEYPLYHVTLHVFKVSHFEGEPEGCEGQIIRWVNRTELERLNFPSANKAIVQQLITIS